MTPEFYMLTRDHTWLSCDEKTYNKLDPDFRMKCYPVPRKPLSDEEIKELANNIVVPMSLDYDWRIAFARAIEERHGIK